MEQKLYLKMKTVLSIVMLFGALTLNAQTHIKDRAGLEAIADDNFGSYVLDNDIDLAGADWVPIEFNGTLNGNGHLIKNLTITDGTNNAGLFGTLSSSVVISNLGFENVNIAGGTTVGTIGAWCDHSIITNCFIKSGTITSPGDLVGGMFGLTYGITVSNCYSNADVSAKGHVGGIIGHMNGGLVEDCHVDADIRASQIAGGGIAGWEAEIPGIIRRCYAKGTVKTYDIGFGGGIVGVMDDANAEHALEIIDCIAAQTVIQYKDSANAGLTRITSNAGKGIVTFTNNYALETIPGEIWTSDANGQDGANMTEEQFKDDTFFGDNLPDWDFGMFGDPVWKMTSSGPLLAWEEESTGILTMKRPASKAIVFANDSKVYVKGAEENATVRIFNTVGSLLHEAKINSSLESFDIKGFLIIEVVSPKARGIYKVNNY